MGHEDNNIRGAVASLQELAVLEAQTLAAEINTLGLLRDRISPVARYGETIQTKYRRLNYKTEQQAEQLEYLSEGFPGSDGGKLLTGLMVIDSYTSLELNSPADGSDPRVGQYAGNRIYLTRDKKWILAERVGAYSEVVGSSSEWDAECKILSDRSLLERYSLDALTQGLFAAANKVWGEHSARLDALKKRSEKAAEVANIVAKLKAFSQEPGAFTLPAQAEDSPAPEAVPTKSLRPNVTRR